MVGNSNDETDSPHKLLLNDTQASRLRKDFANDSSGNKKLSKTQMSKTVQIGRHFFRDIPIFGNSLANAAKDGIDIAKNYSSNFVDKK